jgi:GPH family glycoside/pentoside/hexuronide:cation symporter
MMIFSIAAVICFFITFFTTRERVISVQTEKSSVMQDIGDLFKNKPWLIMLCVIVLVFISLPLRSGTTVYYFKYYAHQDELSRFLNDIGFTGLIAGVQSIWPNFKWPDAVDASAFGLFNGAGVIMMIVGIGFSRPLADRFGKRDVYAFGLFVATVFILSFILIPRDAIGWMFIAQILHGFFYGITIPILWAMIADVADYSEWKNNRRATAIIFSAMILGLKGGIAIGGTLVVSFLAAYGYQVGVEVQSAESINGIKLTMGLFSSIPFFLACALLFLYEINKSVESRIEQDLSARRKGAAAE